MLVAFILFGFSFVCSCLNTQRCFQYVYNYVLGYKQKKLEEAQAQTKAAQQQAAAALQMAQTQKKSYNRQKANALYNMFLNLSSQNNTRNSFSGLGTTTCRVYGAGVNKRVQCY